MGTAPDCACASAAWTVDNRFVIFRKAARRGAHSTIQVMSSHLLMNRAPRRCTGLLLALVLVTAPAAAQTLAQALDQAWLLHPQAQAGTARNAQAAANIEAANGLTPGPATLSLGAVSDRFHANQGQREWEVEMAVPLWLPGQKAAQSAEATSSQAQVVAQQHALRLQLAGELRTAWWAVAAARQTRAQAQQRLDTAQALMANVQRRYRAGELARIDANLAQREVLAAQGALADSDAALLQTEQAFRTLTGTAAPVQLDPEPPAVQDAPDQDHPLRAAASATRAFPPSPENSICARSMS